MYLQVVQIYLSWSNASVPVPKRTLVAFDRIHVKAGQTGHVVSTLEAQKMAVWHDQIEWTVEPGEYTAIAVPFERK